MHVGMTVIAADEATVGLVRDAERLGVDSVWIPETWGYDALTPLAFLAARTSQIRLGTAIVQLGSRSPALLAMSAMSMQAHSGGRFALGLGVSGPQVMESWHGVPFTAPVAATRDTIQIVRQVARGDRLEHHGPVYDLPLPGAAGRPMRTWAPPVEIPIYLASLGPRNLRLTGELADGWIGNTFMPETADVFMTELQKGADEAGRQLDELDLVIPVAVEITEDAEGAAARHAQGYAFTIGAMGSADRNFYNAAFTRQGYGDDVAAVQALWLAGKRDEAAARVPIELGARTNLLGPPEVIRERLRAYQKVGITTLQTKIGGPADQHLDTLAQLIDLVAEVDTESYPRSED